MRSVRVIVTDRERVTVSAGNDESPRKEYPDFAAGIAVNAPGELSS